MLIKCRKCGKEKSLDEIEQIVVKVVGDKNWQYCYCCKICLKELTHGDWIVKDKIYLFKERRAGFLSEETLTNMISHYLLSDYHYSLFSNWRK